MDKPAELGQLCLQIQPGRVPGLDTAAVEQFADAWARRTAGVRGIDISRGEDDGGYLNIVFAAEDPRDAWARLHTPLLDESEFGNQLKTCAMCICTGEDGWNDYLLLYHFDPEVALDPDEDGVSGD